MKVKEDFILSKLTYWGFSDKGHKMVYKASNSLTVNVLKTTRAITLETRKNDHEPFPQLVYDLIKGGVFVWK